MSRSKRRFRWTVEIEVDETWIADGFNLTQDRLTQMILSDLNFAYPHEVGARIVKSPDAKLIRAAQGFSNAGD